MCAFDTLIDILNVCINLKSRDTNQTNVLLKRRASFHKSLLNTSTHVDNLPHICVLPARTLALCLEIVCCQSSFCRALVSELRVGLLLSICVVPTRMDIVPHTLVLMQEKHTCKITFALVSGEMHPHDHVLLASHSLICHLSESPGKLCVLAPLSP